MPRLAARTSGQQVDGVDRLDVGRHVLNPGLQVVGGVVRDVVLAAAVRGGPLDHVQLALAARLVHQVEPEDAGVLPAVRSATMQGASQVCSTGVQTTS